MFISVDCVGRRFIRFSEIRPHFFICRFNLLVPPTWIDTHTGTLAHHTRLHSLFSFVSCQPPRPFLHCRARSFAPIFFEPTHCCCMPIWASQRGCDQISINQRATAQLWSPSADNCNGDKQERSMARAAMSGGSRTQGGGTAYFCQFAGNFFLQIRLPWN